ncbi:hypothetical protein V1264_005287 [Littorina saxatilis]|uniref:Adenomatous polyposis coli protein n=2 Tax=Littorina saxatilis TaxID=31220 RepID=A0AAN9AYW3_9CAEN
MKEIESEEQHRVWFYRQLEIITGKLETLPLSDTYNLQADMARRQLEFEAQQVQGVMTEKLGSAEQSSQRQEARLRRIRTIESELMQLQQQQQLVQRAPAVSRRNVGTSTTLTRAMFSAVPGQEAGGYACERVVAKTTDGRYLATVAVQTADVTLTQEVEGHGGMAAGMPLNADAAAAMYHGAWPIHKDMSMPGSTGGDSGSVSSVMSFNSTSTGGGSASVGRVSSESSVMSFNSNNTHTTSTSQSSAPSSASAKPQPQQLGTKVEMVYSLLSMLGTHDKDDMSRTLLAMSSSQDSCIAMRQSGCLPLLIQLLHGSDKDSGLLGNTRGSAAARARASAALHNIVHSNPDDKRGRREARTLRLLEQIRAHCDQQRGETTAEEEEEEEGAGSKAADIDHHPGPAIAALMKLSFDEDYRHAICTLGGLQAMAELLEVDHTKQGNTGDNYSITVRRYACMALTNLTFGDGKNKALLCSMQPAMHALVAQLRSPNEDLCQGAASVLRNLSWRADLASKKTLREVGAVTTLTESAMAVKKETTLKSILSALWNLSSHCSENKAEICAVKGALEFLVSLLTFKSGGKTHAIVENGGGILRNVSSQIAIREDYRRTLRQKGCLQILLAQLRSTSLTIVSNACGTLWNLSARCSEDQELLRDMGAVGMLRNLVHSKHRMIAMGSSAALRNLLSSAGSGKGMDCDRGNHGNRPTLSARKQRALEEELDAQNLSETCENVESPRDSPTDTPPSRTADGDGRRFVYPFDPSASNNSVHKTEDDPRRALHRRQVQTRCDSSTAEGRVRSPQRVPRASSQDSVTSTHSDISHDRSRVHHMLAKSSHLLHRRQGGSLERKKEPQGLHRVSSEHACSALERGGKNGAQSSRIVRYMQEVAMLAGVGAESNPTPAEPSDQSQHNNHSFSHHAQSQNHRTPPVKPSQQKLYEHLVKKNVSLNLDYDRGDDSDNSEQPVNYSLKYQDTPTTMYPEQSVLGMNVHPTSLQGAGGIHGNVHPGPRAPLPRGAHGAPTRMPNPQVRQFHPGNVRVNNYVGPNVVPQPRHVVPQNVVHGRFPAPHNFNPPQPLSHRQPQPQQQRVQQQQQQPQRPGYTAQRSMQGAQGVNGGPFSAYAETDLDSMDEQPTDFSLRYAEDHSDDQDQPVNYSMRYRNDPDPDCVECKYEEARRTNDRLDQSANDDQVLTFCTEGTPFLSTATSLTDLTGGKQGGEEGEEEETKSPKRCHHRHQEEEEEEEEEGEGADEVQNFSARYGESEDTPGNSSCGHTGSTVRPSGAGAQGHRFGNQPACQPLTGPQQTFHNPDDEILPPDQMKTYCEEGTPVCFSRVSSLSSLHSSEARDSMDQGRPVMMQSIEESEKGEMSTSVIENKNAIGMKAALVDRRNRGTDTPVEKESKTVTFDESRQQQQQVEETPLMFSRCSSLGSLSSFDTQSVHSSVVSEYSRRASQVVSPSELPDSPSETMPPSPTRLQSPPVRSFKPVVAAASVGGGVGSASESAVLNAPSAVKSGQIGNKVDWQRGAEDVHIQVDDELAKLLNIFRSSIPTNNSSNNNANTHQHDDAISMSGKSEVPVVYADEGTPPVWSETWSETSSLSALTVDGDAGNAPSRKKPVSAVSAEPNLSKVEETDSADVTLCETQDNTLVRDDKDSSMSEGEEDILAQCISAAMPAPTNSSRKMRKSGSDNAIKKKSALPKPESQSPCSGASKMSSRLPTKVTPQGMSTPLSKSSKLPSPSSRLAKPEPHNKKGANSPSSAKQGGGNAAKPPRPAGQTRPQTANRQPPPVRHHSVPDDDFAPDTMKTFAEEGTPLNFSAATSLSDLSCVTDAPEKIQSPPSAQKSPEDCKSDTSSLCEESEQQLLNDMIQAAMPKARTARKLDLDKSAAARAQNAGTKAPLRGGPAKQREEARKPPQRQQQQQQQQQQQLHQQQQQQRQPPATKSAVQMEVPYAGDTTQTYATEGTPNNFSAATSLSDLTIDSVDDGARGGRLSSGRSPAKSSHQQGSVATAYKDDGVFGADGTDSPHVYGMEGTPTTFSRNDSLSSIEIIDDNKSESQGFAVSSSRQCPAYPNASERHVLGQSSEEGSVKSQKHRNQPQQQRTGNKDETQQFEMEDTPVSFSRNSSLSSLASGGRAKEPQPEEEPQISRTSSTESLSAESAGFDPTPSEQALLDQCINAAMPKRRPSRGEDRSRRHSRTATKNEGRALQEGGSLKNSALEIRAQFEDTASVGETTTASVTLTAHGERVERREKLMTRSCSDALDMDSDDGGGRPSRFSSWRKNRHGSSSSAHHTKQSREESARSHSQDNLLKTQKEICNRITQSVESSSASSSNSTSRSAQSCTTSVIHVDPAAALGTDNRLLDRHHRDTHAPHHPDHPMVASTTDSSSSGEKADSEKAFSDDHHYQYHTPHFELKPAEDYYEAEEDDDVDQNQTVMEVGNRTLTQRGESFDDDHSSQHDLSQDVVHYEDDLEEKLCFGSGHTSFDQEGESGHASFDQEGESGHASFEQEITPEDELLLQQNASLIVSEIVTKRDMTGSALDDDLFIENETISLVSNDYTSDTASEVSISWSTTSEKMSDRCSSQAETMSSCSAKVVKPESKLPRKTALEEDDGKAVRGRRKPLYTKPSPSSALRLPSKAEARSRPGSGGGANSRPTSGTGGGNSRPTSGGAVGNAKSPAGRVGGGGGPQKKTSPRTPGGQPKSNLPGPKTSTTPVSQKTSPPSNPIRPTAPKTTATGKLQSPAGPRPGSGSGIPRSPAKAGTTPPSRLPAATNRGKDAAERPKPPTKQATFVKDTPTPRATTNNVRLRTRSASRGRVQAEKRSSGCEAAAQRNSTGSPPEAWSKALDSFNFVVDKSAQRNAKDAPGALKRNAAAAATPTVKQQPRPSNIARPQGMGSSPKSSANAGKPGSTASGPKPAATSTRSNLPARTSNTNLNKSGSASSLRKTGSGSSLTKTNSGSSLNKGPTTGTVKKPGVGKVDIKKSESSASLRRGSDGSRPTTPNGRRPSNPRTPDKGGEEVRKAGGKKQVPSKIASLWKKEEAGGVQRSFSVEDHALAPATTKPRNKSSSLPASARNMSISSLTFVRKSSSVNSQSSGGEEQSGSSTEVIPRSSTYDKFPVAKSRGMTWQNSEDEDAAIVSSGEGMLELCDPTGDESENAFESLESGGDVNLDEAYIHEDPEIAAAEREAAMACSVDSLEDASASDNNQLSVTANVIDSSTWRRNKKPVKQGDVSLNLPNADETCRSMNSFLTANDSQNESLARGADMSVWQSCGNDSAISEISFANHDASAVAGGKKSKSKKSVAKSIKSTFAGLKFFGSKQSKSKKFTTDYIEPKIVTHHTTGTSTKTISVPTSKPSPGAIVAPVAPFNYSPPASTPVSVTTTAPTLPPTAQITKDTTADMNGDKDKKTTKHMTKTEMLLARRKQSFLSTSSKDDGSETESNQRGCMVTTV